MAMKTAMQTHQFVMVGLVPATCQSPAHRQHFHHHTHTATLCTYDYSRNCVKIWLLADNSKMGGSNKNSVSEYWWTLSSYTQKPKWWKGGYCSSTQCTKNSFCYDSDTMWVQQRLKYGSNASHSVQVAVHNISGLKSIVDRSFSLSLYCSGELCGTAKRAFRFGDVWWMGWQELICRFPTKVGPHYRRVLATLVMSLQLNWVKSKNGSLF